MPTPKPKKVGRPTLPKGNAKDVMLRVRVTANDLKAMKALAKVTGRAFPTGFAARFMRHFNPENGGHNEKKITGSGGHKRPRDKREVSKNSTHQSSKETACPTQGQEACQKAVNVMGKLGHYPQLRFYRISSSSSV